MFFLLPLSLPSYVLCHRATLLSICSLFLKKEKRKREDVFPRNAQIFRDGSYAWTRDEQVLYHRFRGRLMKNIKCSLIWFGNDVRVCVWEKERVCVCVCVCWPPTSDRSTAALKKGKLAHVAPVRVVLFHFCSSSGRGNDITRKDNQY